MSLAVSKNRYRQIIKCNTRIVSILYTWYRYRYNLYLFKFLDYHISFANITYSLFDLDYYNLINRITIKKIIECKRMSLYYWLIEERQKYTIILIEIPLFTKFSLQISILKWPLKYHKIKKFQRKK